MLALLRSDDLIDALVIMNCGDAASAQARHIYRESLRSLVRLAKAERNAELRLTLTHMPARSQSGLRH